MVTASLNGISTIRSSNAQSRLIEEFDIKQVGNTSYSILISLHKNGL